MKLLKQHFAQSVDEVLITSELAQRPARPPDYAAENEALGTLARAMSEEPAAILQRLAELTRTLCRADSAGVSILEPGAATRSVFRWRAIAGDFAVNKGGSLPRHNSPCGTVLDRNSMLLFNDPGRFFPESRKLRPRIFEALLVPFHHGAQPVGTVWAIAHRPDRHFDAEDARLLNSLSSFAAAAHERQRIENDLRDSHATALKLMEQAMLAGNNAEQAMAAFRASEQETKRARDYAEATLRTSPVPLLVLERDFRVKTANDAFYETFKVEPARTEGRLVYQLGNGQWDIPRLRELLDGILRHHAGFRNFEVRHDFENIGQRTMLLNARRMENEAGVPERIVLVIEDITARKHAEESLRETERQQRLLADLGEMLLRLSDPAALISEIGRRVATHFAVARCGYSRVEAENDRFVVEQDYHDPQLASLVGSYAISDYADHIVAEARAGQPTIVEDAMTDPRTRDIYQQRYAPIAVRSYITVPLVRDQQWIASFWISHHQPCQWTRADVLFLRAVADRVMLAVEDVRVCADLRSAHEQLADRTDHLEGLVVERTARLQQTIEELEHFSYTITHDMRAPLRSMQGFAALLLQDCAADLKAESADYLRRILAAANRMDALIQDSLQYAKVVREKLPLARVDSGAALRGILESYPTLQPPKAEVQLVGPFPPVIANHAGLSQCFSNLLTNAIKFVKPGIKPTVRICAETRAGSDPGLAGSSPDTPKVRFWFEDNGIGIPPEYHERIFDMFQQLDKTYEGTGIGLALVRKTAERMEGRVGVESEPGQGSRFWLEFNQAA